MNRTQRRLMAKAEQRQTPAPSDDIVKINYAVDPVNRTAVMQFSRSISNLALTVPQALKTVLGILEGAQMLDPQALADFKWPGKKNITEPLGATAKSS